MRYVIENKIYEISRGDVVLIPKGTLHSTAYDTEETERMLINFSDEFVADERLFSCFKTRVISLSDKKAFEFEAIFKKIMREIERDDEYSRLLARQHTTEILIMLKRREQAGRSSAAYGYPALMQRAMDFIERNAHTSISLDDVSRELSLSRSFFSRKFKEITGFGFSEYLAHVRIKRAEQMLLSGKKSITDIAFECGFEDSSYFAATFKKIMGTTPLKYRAEK
jgi:AraC-like DNA-binding protein